MQVHSFTADSAGDALSRIREELGPDAVVLHTRPAPVPGLSRLWRRPRIEVLAARPEAPPPEPAAELLDGFRSELAGLRLELEKRASAPESTAFADARPRATDARADGWRVGSLLEASGLLPVHAGAVVEKLHSAHGAPPESIREEVEMTRTMLREIWAESLPAAVPSSSLHVFVGAAGVGKTTCLCKWLTKAVLVENRTASVWRLDARVANTAESLSLYCEILDVPVQRSWQAPPPVPSADVRFVDLPGVNWRSGAELSDLTEQIQRFPGAQVHLVLNGAYELPLLMDQVRRFAALPLTDLIVTHLEEEPRWGKLWNFVLGTNYSVRFLSAGQNIPGDLEEASAEKILARQFLAN